MDAADRLARLLTLAEPANPVGEMDFEQAEAALGRPFPAEYRDWLVAAGLEAAEGFELFLEPLPPSAAEHDGIGAVATMGDAFRTLGWALPEELVPVGGNGGDEMFGLWMPRDRAEPPVVVAFDMGLDEGDRSLWIVGSSWLAFLEGWFVVNAGENGPEDVWDQLAVPAELRDDDPDDETVLTEQLRFANPGWPEVAYPWGEPAFTVGELRALLASR